jgi:hypothetical protein
MLPASGLFRTLQTQAASATRRLSTDFAEQHRLGYEFVALFVADASSIRCIVFRGLQLQAVFATKENPPTAAAAQAVSCLENVSVVTTDTRSEYPDCDIGVRGE